MFSNWAELVPNPNTGAGVVTVYAFGYNYWGSLGNGTQADAWFPTRVKTTQNTAGAAVGRGQSAAAQLAVIVSAPGEHKAIVPDHDRMLTAHSDGADIGKVPPLPIRSPARPFPSP